MSLFNKGQIFVNCRVGIRFPCRLSGARIFRGYNGALAPPSTKQAGWIALQEKKKHDKANARSLTAAEASEREARQQEKQEKQVPRPIYQSPPHQLFVLLPAFLRLPDYSANSTTSEAPRAA